MTKHDLIIRGGTVVDGSGTAPFTGDVAMRDGLITEVGTVTGEAEREIDATGAVVTPGFVDIHTHYDAQATWAEQFQPSSWHGVTTVVMGNCGVGFAPALPENHARLIELMEGVEDIPGVALDEGLPWNWESFGDYLDSLDGKPTDLDFAAYLPHAALRVHVMGARAMAHEAATEDEIAQMAQIAREAMEKGAMGFSTSRTLNHKSVSGELICSYDAGRDELVAIAKAIGESGRGTLQLITDWDEIDVDLSMARDMMAASGRPLTFSLLQMPKYPQRYREILDAVEALRAEGFTITAQVAPRPIGLLFGLELSLNPFGSSKNYQQIAHLPLSERVERMHDAHVRAAIIDDSIVADKNVIGSGFLRRFDEIYELADPPSYEPDPEQTIAKRSEREGRSPAEIIYDILLQNDGKGMLYQTFANYAEGNLDTVRDMLQHEAAVLGLSDGGAHVGTICDGSFPTTLLQHWVRDRERGRLPIEHVVNLQARRTAETVGLLDRGLLKPGYRADVNVIDVDRLHLHRPEVHYDLPAGGRRLLQRADGYRHTIVAGVETYRDGEPTGSLPGRLVRGSRPEPATV